MLRDLNRDNTQIGNPQLMSVPVHMFSSSLKPITPTRPVAEMGEYHLPWLPTSYFIAESPVTHEYDGGCFLIMESYSKGL